MNLRCAAISLLTAVPLATASFGVDVDFSRGDPAVKFAAGELKRLLKDVPGAIALREDSSMEAQAWRVKAEGEDEQAAVEAIVAFVESGMGD